MDRLPKRSVSDANLTEAPAISIVFPVYKEEESVLPLYRKIREDCEPMGKPYEMVFVDDGGVLQ